MIKLIKKEQAEARKISNTYTVFNMLTKKISKKVSVALAEGKNHSEITKNIRSDRIYYVLDGKLTVVQGKKVYVVNPGDIIFIEKNIPYHFKGTFKAVLINVPAFNQKNERIKVIE
ncbi:MAG: cupin domain-containing protein [Candidatus Aenigmatarchaeota archaeon]